MNKVEFLKELKNRLAGIPEEDIKRTLDYYEESIADRVDSGMTEKEAVKDLGSIDEIVKNVLADVSFPKILKEKVKPKRKSGVLEIILLILGFPLWFPLLVTVGVLVFVLYVLIWSVIPIYYGMNLVVAACAICGVGAFGLFVYANRILYGLFCLGGGMVCAGLAILFFLFGTVIVRGVLKLSKGTVTGIKRMIVGRGE